MKNYNYMVMALASFLGVTILYMFFKGMEVIPFAIGGLTGMIIYFSIESWHRQKHGAPEGDERIQKDQNTGLAVLSILMGLGVIVLIVVMTYG